MSSAGRTTGVRTRPEWLAGAVLAGLLAASCGSGSGGESESGDDRATGVDPSSDATDQTRCALTTLDLIEVPVQEASGATAWLGDAGFTIAVVGDREWEVLTAEQAKSDDPGEWSRLDLAELDGWPEDDGDSQLEAIAAAGPSEIAVMQEDPPVVTTFDLAGQKVTREILLREPGDGDLDWEDSESRGEGLALLSGGRLLVAKEKDPAALVVFGPESDEPQAPQDATLERDDFLARGETWNGPLGESEYVPSVVLDLTDQPDLADVSGVAVGPDSSLWLLSDESRTLAEVSLDEPVVTGRTLDLARTCALPDVEGKPEGVVALGDDQFLVAFDVDDSDTNAVIGELDASSEDAEPQGG